MKNKILSNYVYNLIYQIMVFIIPLVTAPFLSRILGVDGIGEYSYNYSIAYYFSLFVMLGLNNYGNRSIAKCLENKEKINDVFLEIYGMQLICGLIVIFIYIIYYLILQRERIVLAFLPFIVASTFDVSWFFFGQEKFKVILARNITIKILTTILIFILIRTKYDLLLYSFIISIGTLLSQIITWPFVLRQIKIKVISIKRMYKHIIPNLVLFIPVVAVSIYRTMDKIMLGKMTDYLEVGYYENAEKIISVIMSVITTLGTVMLPRMSALYEKKEDEKIREMLRNSFVYITLIVSIICFGIASISENLVVVYYGEDFYGAASILKLLCITIPFISYANIIRTQILIPQCNEKSYVISCVIGAIVNLIVNFCLIPRLGGIGAAIGTVIAEIVVFSIQYLSVKKYIEIANYKSNIIKYWLMGFVMYIVIISIKPIFSNNLFGLLLLMVVGGCVSLMFIIFETFILKDRYLKLLFNKIIRKRR